MTSLPCVGENAWKWDIDHANHNLIVGPCLPCSQAVTGCLSCPLLDRCAKQASIGMIRGAVAYIHDTKKITGFRKARTCHACGNPIVGQYHRDYCSVSCRKDTVWTVTMAQAQADHHRFLVMEST